MHAKSILRVITTVTLSHRPSYILVEFRRWMTTVVVASRLRVKLDEYGWKPARSNGEMLDETDERLCFRHDQDGCTGERTPGQAVRGRLSNSRIAHASSFRPLTSGRQTQRERLDARQAEGNFWSGRSSPSKGNRRRVNLQRRFAIVSETARGSMSRVYRALDNQTGRTVCLKVQSQAKNEAAASRASAHEPRPLEGEMAMHLVHPHIVRTFEYGLSTQGEHFVVMEFIDGVSLQFIRETRSARTAEKVELLAQAAEGLAAVHAAGFIHHDINPRNFLVNREQHVKLIDFGLTIPNTPAFCRPGNRTGTLQYMAPELLAARTDRRADRHLRLRSHGLRVPDRPPPLRRQQLDHADAPAHQYRAARPRRGQAEAVRGALHHPPPVDGPAQGTTLADAEHAAGCAAQPPRETSERTKLVEVSRLKSASFIRPPSSAHSERVARMTRGCLAWSWTVGARRSCACASIKARTGLLLVAADLEDQVAPRLQEPRRTPRSAVQPYRARPGRRRGPSAARNPAPPARDVRSPRVGM